MEEGNRKTQQELMEAIDKRFASPSERAHEIWSIISSVPVLVEKTDWDLLCFCVEFIGMMSQTWNWLEDDAKKLAKLVYTAHYLDRQTDDAKLERVRRNQHSNSDSGKQPERKSSGNSNEFTPSSSPFE